MEPATRVEIRDNTDNGEKEGLVNISIILGPGDVEIVTDVEEKLEQVYQGKISGILSMLYHWTRIIVHNIGTTYISTLISANSIVCTM